MRAGRTCVPPPCWQGKSCSIYSVRPAQCRTYPFWPEIVQSPHHWAAESARCEGIALTKKLEQQPPAASPGAVVPHDEVLLNMIIEDVHRDVRDRMAQCISRAPLLPAVIPINVRVLALGPLRCADNHRRCTSRIDTAGFRHDVRRVPDAHLRS